MRGLVLLYLFLTTFHFNAQERLKVRSKGVSISQNLTPKESLEEAINEAKVNALRKTGISEQITKSSLLISNSDGDTSNDEYQEYSAIRVSANILVEEILNRVSSFDKYGNLVTEVEIESTIFKYGKNKSGSPVFQVDGLRETYYEKDLIKFSVTPSQDSYLSIYVFNEDETFRLYPFHDSNGVINDNPDMIFKGHIATQFPINPLIGDGYSIELKDESEISTLLFIAYREKMRFLGNIDDKKEIFRWIYSLSQDDVSFQIFNIQLKH